MFRKFAGLEPEERMLLVQALGVITRVRLALWLLPFKTVAGLEGRGSKHNSGGTNLRFARRASWAVNRASRVVPGASCLTQAIALQRLLDGAGLSSELCIGVTKELHARFEAHAWLEHAGVVVIGGSQSPNLFHPLPPLPHSPAKR